jgi:hypothetical protein
VDTTNGVTWQNIGTKASPVWGLPSALVRVSLSSANLLAMNGTPVAILPAPGANFAIIVDSIAFVMIATSTAYASGGTVQFNYHGGVSSHSGTIPASVVTTGTPGTVVTQLGPSTGSNGLTVPANTGIDITNNTGAFTTGTGTAIVYVSYSVIAIS